MKLSEPDSDFSRRLLRNTSGIGLCAVHPVESFTALAVLGVP